MNLFGKSNFIRIYDNALTKKECDILISIFEKSKTSPGECWKDGCKVEDPLYKKCMEVKGLKFSNGLSIDNIIKSALDKYIIEYKNSFKSFQHLCEWKLDDGYSFQKYETEDDGFKKWHTEHGPGVSAYRMLVWMFYLNNAKSGTEFMHYPTVNAKEGRLVIWPSGFEYVHRGVPNKGLKYIVTGWASYLE